MRDSINQIMNRAYQAAQYQGLGYSAFHETDYVTKEFKKTMLGCDSYADVIAKTNEITDPPNLSYEESEMHFFDKMETELNDYSGHKLLAEQNGIEIKRTEGINDYYDLSSRCRVKKKETIYRFDDIENDYHIDFTYETKAIGLIGERTKGDAIHIMIIKCDPDKQGRVWQLKKTIQRFKKAFLDDAGVRLCYGRVVPENQYGVKVKPNGELNWRKTEQNLKNYNDGNDGENPTWKLLNLWVRLGWIYADFLDFKYPMIYLISETYKEELMKDKKMASWLRERLQFSRYEKQ